MKFFTAIILFFFTLAFTACKTKKEATNSACFKGRLEVKGICANYTIKLLEGNLDATKMVSGWKDEVTGKTHSNVFALGNPCSFPDSLKEGNEFYFVLDDTKQDCAVCMAYYPKPEKALTIKVLDKPCN